MGGNIGTAILSLEPPAERPRPRRSRCRRSRSTSRHRLTPTIGVLLNISPDHLDRHGTMERLRGDQGAARRRGRSRRHRRSTTRSAAPSPTRRADGGKPLRPHLDRARSIRRACSPEARRLVSRRWRRPGGLRRHRRHRLAARHAQRPECARRRSRSRDALGVSGRGDPRRPRDLPGPAASHGGGRPARPRALHQRFEGDERRFDREGARLLRATSSGSSAASRRRAASTALRPYFPKIDKAYLIGEASEAFAGNARGRGALSCAAARSTRRSPRPREDAARSSAPSRSCCSRRPAPPTTSSRISRSAATTSASSCGRCPGIEH